MKYNYLNCGCGKCFNVDWINIDSCSHNKYIIIHDLNLGIPFKNNFFEVVYHSHLLEHFEKNNAVAFIRECFRVLKPEGILRVVVPDLEKIVELYLIALKKSIIGSEEWIENYEWMMMEIYDQTVRNYSGGMMADYLSDNNIKNKIFILKRIGQEAQNFFEKKIKKNKKDKLIFREWFIRKILGEADYSALKIGRFRQNGEVHQWMYDSYSLYKLLKECGFVEIQKKNADESLIKNWIDFQLDTDENKVARKPDSIYMEAVKPKYLQ